MVHDQKKSPVEGYRVGFDEARGWYCVVRRKGGRFVESGFPSEAKAYGRVAAEIVLGKPKAAFILRDPVRYLKRGGPATPPPG
jgi:hypothetical protein